MILNNLYEEFLKNTNLLDATYKTVFIRINDIFSSLNLITFKKFKYTLENDSLEFDFDNLDSNTIPSYVIDTIKNLFDRFFSFPKWSEITLDILYDGKPFQIKHSKGKTVIPTQIDFLEKYKLFPFFIAELQNKDPYDLFDNLFRFLIIKDSSKTLFSPLKSLFERIDAIEQIDKQEVTAKSAASYSLVIEDLQDNKEKIVKELDGVKQKREELKQLKEDLMQFAFFKDKYEQEYRSLSDDYKYLKDQKNSYLKKHEELIQLLKEVDGNLSDINAQETRDEKELKYYLDHKKFLQEKGTILTNTIKEVTTLQDTTKSRVEELEGIFTKYNAFKLEDLDKISKDLEGVEKKQERLYANLINIDSNIKHAKESQTQENIVIEKSSYSDHVIQNSLAQGIPDFLAKPELPQSTTIVKNYLKQYFVYHCEKAVQEDNLKEITSNIVFNILRDKFKFNPTVLFSIDDIEGFNTINILS